MATKTGPKAQRPAHKKRTSIGNSKRSKAKGKNDVRNRKGRP